MNTAAVGASAWSSTSRVAWNFNCIRKCINRILYISRLADEKKSQQLKFQ
jgi:hypothetical protein